ncbi:GFA family protein [Thalassomonas actiniarum]|uniref:GFA family protein n=1 Tax=Thalassomonas actiniarum TaxID=485447 RepID=A0AAE9YNZ6_9GAMM|nr:GFA family protein [Thalassomonas actiniarum]WDD97563.1 GFA family protein [Thalassomonas actiniarum]
MNGKCLCGKVTFAITGTLPNLYQCHCSLCRKLTGSSSDSAMFLSREQFSWRSGEQLISSYKTETGFRSDFCQNCGSTVPHLMNNQKQYWIPAGLLEGESDIKVAAHLFVGSKCQWDMIGDDGIQYEEMPDMATLDKVLQREQS